MSEKDRKVTSAGVVKESSELRKERELVKQGIKFQEEPSHQKKSVDAEETKQVEKEKEKK